MQGTTSPASTDLGCQVPLLPQQALPSGVTLQHTLQCWRVIPCHLLLHVQDADVRGDAQALAGDHLQQRGLAQPVPAHQPIAPSKSQVQVCSSQQDTEAREQAGPCSDCAMEWGKLTATCPRCISGTKQPPQASPAQSRQGQCPPCFLIFATPSVIPQLLSNPVPAPHGPKWQPGPVPHPQLTHRSPKDTSKFSMRTSYDLFLPEDSMRVSFLLEAWLADASSRTLQTGRTQRGGSTGQLWYSPIPATLSRAGRGCSKCPAYSHRAR